MKLAPNLHRIGNDIVAAYLVLTDEGITIIDAGLAGHWRDLQRELAAVGRPLSDIRGIVLTHGDTDHIGFAERLRLTTGIPVYVHSADAARAKGQAKARAKGDAKGEAKPKASAGRLRLGPIIGFLAYALRKGGWRTKYLTDVVPVEDGDVLDLPGSPQIIGLPGHSPGSVAVYVTSAGALFVGDALTTRHVLTGQLGPQPAPFTDDPTQALEVLDRVTGLQQVEWVLPGHGAPWNGQLAGLAAEVRAQA